MKSLVLAAAALLTLLSPSVEAQAPTSGAMIYVEPTDDHFETYIIAALLKKKVPVSVVQNPEMATLTLRAAVVQEHKESTGSKVVKCLFASCSGTADKANTNAQLINRESVVVWSYSVNNARGEKNRQSMAEAIAEHLKEDYFRR